MQARIEEKLKTAFLPLRLAVVNDSHLHKGPKDAQTHWNVVIVAEAFAGKSLVERHRAVYGVLGEELRGGVHALAVKALTPTEWEARGGDMTNPAPLCRGG
jgi:BolA protein